MTRRDPDVLTADAAAAGVVGELPDPFVVLGLLVAWVLTGLLVARYMAGHGHDFRFVAGLGAAMGPLFLPLALDHLHRRDPWTQPVALRDRATTGRRTVVVLDGAPERAADALPVLRRITDPGTVALAVPVGYSTLRAPEHDETRRAAVRRAEQAAQLLHEFDPVPVLAPGSAKDVIDRLEIGEDDIVLAVGPDRGGHPDHGHVAVVSVPGDGGR